jgi:hypothetical protein
VLRFITPTMISQGSPSRRPEFGMFTRRLRDRLKIVAATHCGCRLPFDLHGMSSKAGDVTLLPQAGRADDAASYFGLLGDFVPLLRLGTHLHVGKFCAFGQGWYQIAG